MQTDVQKKLFKIESELSGVVTKTVMMTPEDFIAHTKNEITKAQGEPEEKARKRLLVLQKSVLYSSDIIEDTEADSIKVPVCVIEQTAVDEQENRIMTPAASAGLNPSDGTVFEGGFVAKKLEEIEALLKAFGKPPAPPQPPTPPTPPGASGPPAAGDEEGPPESEKEGKKKTDKVWPDDMNDPNFVQKGEVNQDSEWGNDPK